MSRCFINELQDQQSVREIFRASEKQLRPNRNGKLYLQFHLADRTGTIGARLWNATEEIASQFDNSDYIRVEGTVQLFQGALQMIVTKIERVPREEIDEADFVQQSRVNVDKTLQRLRELLRELNSPELTTLGECFLMDHDFLNDFCRAPAGIKLHHAYPGGLLEHSVNMMEVAMQIAPRYPQADRDLLMLGAFLHDIGKVRELAYEDDYSYSDEGQLLGHPVIAVGLFDEKVREAEEFLGEPLSKESVLRLKHMIVSHHGLLEHGSPKVPMTIEAMMLHLLDTLDSKVAEFERQMFEDPNPSSPWTFFIPTLGRKLFRGEKRNES